VSRPEAFHQSNAIETARDEAPRCHRDRDAAEQHADEGREDEEPFSVADGGTHFAFEAYGSSRMAGASRMYLASIDCAAGDLERAEVGARAAADLLSTVPPLHPQALATLARVLLARGSVTDALALARSAVAELSPGDRPESGEARVRLVLAEALSAAGLGEEAARVIVEARDVLVARASSIAAPDLRARFLLAVPDNARTIALALEWTVSD